MGRKKIEIKLIKNERLRKVPPSAIQITYNKRKRGLLKKLVELSVICGIQAKLEMRDSFGNLIVVDAGKNAEQPLSEVPKEKVFVFTQADYPEFKGFEKIRRRHQEDEEDGVLEDRPRDLESQKQMEKMGKVEPFADNSEVSKAQPPAEHSPGKLLIPQPIHPMVQQPLVPQTEVPMNSPTMDYLCYMQNVHLRNQLDYAEMQYRTLMAQFMNGQL